MEDALGPGPPACDWGVTSDGPADGEPPALNANEEAPPHSRRGLERFSFGGVGFPPLGVIPD